MPITALPQPRFAAQFARAPMPCGGPVGFGLPMHAGFQPAGAWKLPAR